MSWHEKYLSKNNNKKSVSTRDDLFDLFEEVLRDGPIIEMSDKARRVEAEKFMLTLPSFVPTEAWGDPKSTDRKTLNRIFSVIGGGASIEGKLAYLQRITDPSNRITSPRRVISSLIILEALATLIADFNEASAGFVFEGWLAALLQGHQEAGRDDDKGNLPIEDLMAFSQLKAGSEPVPVSLKLLSPNTPIHGSYTNLLDALFDNDQFGGRVNYVVARKLESHVVLQSFDISRDNVINLLSLQKGSKAVPLKTKKKGGALFVIIDPSTAQRYGIETGDVEASLKVLLQLQQEKSYDELYKVLIMTAGYEKNARKRKLARLDQEPEEMPLGSPAAPEVDPEEQMRLQREAIRQYTEREKLLKEASETQWSLSVNQVDDLANAGIYKLVTLGELPKTREAVVEVAMMHMDTIREKFQTLFKAFSDLSNNINKYITFPKRSAAMAAGERAINDTGVIQQEIKESVSADESATEEAFD
jgi:hypothetical protein